MRFSHLSTGAAALLLACMLALSAFGAAGATAQESASNAGNQSENYEIAIDSETRVVSSEWSGDTVTIVLESDVTRQVTITDASQRLEGAVDIRRQQTTIPGGERVEVEFTVRDSDQPAVTVGTSYGLVGLGDQSGGGTTWFDGPASWGLIFLTVVVTGYGTFWGTKRHLEKQEREQDERQMEVIGR